MGTLRAGSKSSSGDFILSYLIMIMVEHLRQAQSASIDASAKYEARGSDSTENASAKRKVEGVKRPRMQAQSAKPEGSKRPSRRARMSAANIGAS